MACGIVLGDVFLCPPDGKGDKEQLRHTHHRQQSLFMARPLWTLQLQRCWSPCTHAAARIHRRGPLNHKLQLTAPPPRGNLEPVTNRGVTFTNRRKGDKKEEVEPRWSLLTPL